jgi:PPP family 3-phenylpropionic acid transporter
MSPRPLPRYRLAALYLCFYAGAALLITFWPHYMTSIGLDYADIGLVFGVGTLMGIVAQPSLTVLSDYLGMPVRLLQILATAAVAFLFGVPFVAGFFGLATLMWFSAVPRSAIVPLLDATAVRSLGAERFGALRVWGSVGYGVAAATFGLLARNLSYETAGLYSVWTYLVLACVLVALTLTLPKDAPSGERPGARAFIGLATNPRLLFFLGVQALHWAGMMYFNVYLSLHTRAMELPLVVPSVAIFVSIAAEILAFWVARPFVTGRRAPWALVVVMAVTVLRWLIMAVAEDAWLIIAVQALHFFSFGVWYAACIVALTEYAPAAQRGAIQGLFAATVFGVGGGLGSVLGGEIAQAGGSGSGFAAAAGLDGLALLACLFVALRGRWRRAEST